ncbi:M43 family zinc metalloprotease [Chitinophagales bacterium]|nr:M43 family zinc metalloprotease [Chitinophagales bacterium]
MKIIYYLGIFCCMLLTSVGLIAQSEITPERNCSAMEVLAAQELTNPKRAAKLEAIEKHTQKVNTSLMKAVDGIITIPVVVHVVYGTSSENISDAQVQSQIDVLNDDFRRNNSDANGTWSQAADTQIEFCLASVDPSGTATNGITRTSTSVSAFGTNDQMKYSSQGGKDAWPADAYLNMWSCDISGGILGYAQFPGGSPATDGVVMDYQYFGTIGTATSPFDLGRTATHEVGHWLNLRHIWGDGNCNVDDFVSDTPTSDAANYGCASSHSSCSSLDMVQNYMDYSDDACMNLFTEGQKSRMRALFEPGGAKASLLTSAACGVVGPAPTCSDNIQNQGETGVDCGGPCDPCPCNGTNIVVTIKLDNYPAETSWTLTNSSGSAVASGSGYSSAGTTVSVSSCLADGCYDFTINDSYGDGVCCGYGNGSYSVTDGSSSVASGGSFSSTETTNFCLGGGPTPTCSDNIQNQGEEGVDCGGPCEACVPDPTCSDNIQNQGEEGVDCGGPCIACPTCTDNIQNQGEEGVDCGGPCSPCGGGGECSDVDVDDHDFEAGWGVWNDGGSDSRRSYNDRNYANGNYCVRLRDNTSTSTMTTDNLSLNGFEEVTIDFSYYARSMENGEDFWLQASLDGGANYQTVVTWARGTDFNNNTRYYESVTMTGAFTNSTRLRFRNDASGNSDWVYIDDVIITGCASAARLSGEDTEESNELAMIEQLSQENSISELVLFPNPASNFLNVSFNLLQESPVQIVVMDMAGRVVIIEEIESKGVGQYDLQLPTADLNSEIYFVHLITNDSRTTKRFVVIH